jgi:Na+-transporting methylmalonyl-CoA/oxaloacetate decarboxylase gamma subunit
MIIGQALLGLFLFAYLMAFIGELIRKNDIKKEYKKCNCKSILSLKEFTEKYYNRI